MHLLLLAFFLWGFSYLLQERSPSGSPGAVLMVISKITCRRKETYSSSWEKKLHLTRLHTFAQSSSCWLLQYISKLGCHSNFSSLQQSNFKDMHAPRWIWCRKDFTWHVHKPSLLPIVIFIIQQTMYGLPDSLTFSPSSSLVSQSSWTLVPL